MEIKIAGKSEMPSKFTQQHAWDEIELWTKEMGYNSLYHKVKDTDLFAVEDKFHPHCRRKFRTDYHNRVRTLQRAQNRENTDQSRKTAAHNQAFKTVVDFIHNHIIKQEEGVHMSSLGLIYINVLDENGFPNRDYRSENLMYRLQNNPDISSKILFTKVDPGDRGYVSFYPVYDARITVDDAVFRAYKLASTDKTKDVALFLRGLIRRAFKETNAHSWPPTAEDLNIKSDLLPGDLRKFLDVVMAGKPVVSCEKTNRLVLSIGQNIFCSVTDREWRLPKYILLCITIRHLYCSKQLANIIYRLGHCDSYDFGLEFETAQAKVIDQISILLTSQIVTGE